MIYCWSCCLFQEFLYPPYPPHPRKRKFASLSLTASTIQVHPHRYLATHAEALNAHNLTP